MRKAIGRVVHRTFLLDVPVSVCETSERLFVATTWDKPAHDFMKLSLDAESIREALLQAREVLAELPNIERFSTPPTFGISRIE